MQLGSGGAVLDALLAGRGGVAEREAEGVVVDQPEGLGGLAAGQAGGLQRGEERLGQGEGCGADWVAGLEQGGDAGVIFENRPQPARERGNLPGPGESGVGLAVDLGQDAVEDEVIQLLLAAWACASSGDCV